MAQSAVNISRLIYWRLSTLANIRQLTILARGWANIAIAQRLTFIIVDVIGPKLAHGKTAVASSASWTGSRTGFLLVCVPSDLNPTCDFFFPRLSRTEVFHWSVAN